jgi:TolB-like protein
MEQGSLAFGPFVLDPARGVLRRDGAAVALGQRALAVLTALAEAPGRTVGKADLLERAWPGTIVEEGNLTAQIAALRKALGAERDWILTVPRVGYRLALPAPATPDPAIIPSLAVLPFANLGGDPEQDWFSDGVVDDIITALSRFRSFAVVARSSSFAYKGRAADVRQVAAELGVRYVLEGSVRRAGDTLRITAQLVDGTTGAHLWAERFDGAAAAAVELQDGVAATVAMQVERHVNDAETTRAHAERPGGASAHDVVLHAMTWTKAAAENAAAYAELTAALRREPDNPHLLSHAAATLEQRIAMGWPPFGPDDRERCRELARRGLLNAAGDAKVMADCGMALLQGAREYDWGLAVLESALAANPNDERVVVRTGVAHLHCGDIEQALACFHRAYRLSRGWAAGASLTGIAHAHLVLGNHAEARDWATRSLAANPAYDPTFWMLIAANAHLGRMDEARRHLAEFRRLAPDVTVASIRAGQCARDPGRIEPILDGLRRAGLPEG